MQNCNLWLSIAIPTYNRPILLKACLDSIVRQLVPGVEIVICDNSTTDVAGHAVCEYQERFPDVRYCKNVSNIGSDANILRCLCESRGKFVYLLADDDIMLPGSLVKIRESLKHNPSVGCVHLNSYAFVGDPETGRASTPKFPVDRDVVFKDKNQFLEHLGVNFTFLSAMILRRDYFERIANPKAYVGTLLLHCHIALKCISAAGENLLIATPCIAARSGNSGGYNLYRVFAQGWREVLFTTGIECGFDRRAMERIFDKTIKTFLRYWLIHMKTASTGYDSSGVALLFRETWSYPSAWIYLYPFLGLPGWMLRLVRRLYDQMRVASRIFLKIIAQAVV